MQFAIAFYRDILLDAAMQHGSTLHFKQAVLADALRERRMIAGIYNSAELQLAPHQILVRNDSLYLAAVNPSKNRRIDEEPALGYFKLDGLTDLELTEEVFEPLEESALGAVRDGDRIIASVE